MSYFDGENWMPIGSGDDDENPRWIERLAEFIVENDPFDLYMDEDDVIRVIRYASAGFIYVLLILTGYTIIGKLLWGLE